ncbi:hypothetical protein TWF481_000753 [Arthrobotrys musiformis]|uniref:DC-UbP/UBTD2 N-terminal domain-containing protein n=1 Tax=Arthrobotrys musiformis TaxID=47236 RepID=A0AAV9WPP0_9PEZI
MGGCLSTNRRSGGGGGGASSGRESRNNRRSRRSRNNIPPAQRLDRPLKRPARWVHDVEKDGPPPSITSLQRERDDFWFTRVSGRPEVWATIKGICEMLMEDNSAEALANARSMLAAAEITLPNGSFESGAWDKMGNRYKVPRHILSNPANVGKASPPRTSIKSKDSKESIKSDMAEGREATLTAMPYMVKFRVQEGGNVSDMEIEVWTDEKLKRAANRLIVKAGLSPENHVARLMVDGKSFDLDKTLEDPDQPVWLATRIIQVFIREVISSQPPLSSSPPTQSVGAPEAGPAQSDTEPSKTFDENQVPEVSQQGESSGSKPSMENKNPKTSKEA